MKLEWFEVQGYKNIGAPLRLADLGRINILHGDNNVGKSNLLESLGLFFLLFRTLSEDGPKVAERYELGPQIPVGDVTSTVRTNGFFADHGFAAEDIFHFLEPQPIRLRARLCLTPTELPANAPEWMTQPLEVCLCAERIQNGISVRLMELRGSDGFDLGAETKPYGEKTIALIRGLLDVVGRRFPNVPRGSRFLLIRADRTILSESMYVTADQGPFTGREPLPQDLAQALYDAEGGKDVTKKRRFKRFIDSLEVFRDVIGEGQWRMWYDPDAGRADLRFLVDEGYLPLRAMGSGIQQIVNLVGRIVMSDADVVAIEEPELNLRYVAQLRLREILERLAKDATLGQVFVTSHSPAFELSPMFHLLLRSDTGPRVERRAAEQAIQFTNPEVQFPPKDARAPISYVTTEGLVRVPPNIREKLALQEGGGVVFAEAKDGYIRMLTDDQFSNLFEVPEESK